MDLFKKSTIIGVSVTPGIGLEAAVIDYASHTVLKYAKRPLEYNYTQRAIADLDIFKETLQNLFEEMEIPKGSYVSLNLPNLFFSVKDYPASMENFEIQNAIEDELAEDFRFKDNEACYSYVKLPNVSMQFNKIAYTAYQRSIIIEIVLFIKEMGYRIASIDTSINSALNALMYLGRVNTEADTNWLLMLVDNNSVTITSMLGNSYVDVFEERISIGEVLGDAENYSTVVSAVEPLLKNIPAKYLCVVSRTDVISAEALANKLTYSAPITYQEANSFSGEALLDVDPMIDELVSKQISLDVIGAAINKNFASVSVAHLSLFNETLGDIYLSEQPLQVNIGGHIIELTDQNLIKIFIVLAIFIFSLSIFIVFLILPNISQQKKEVSKIENEISEINKFLQENKDISADLFDEGIEIRTGVTRNKSIYSYYTIVGTEIPKKLWLTHLKLSDKVTIDGQADNLESIYSFFRVLKEYAPESDIKLQKLGLASKSTVIDEDISYDTAAILNSMNADFYEFRISNETEVSASDISENGENGENGSKVDGKENSVGIFNKSKSNSNANMNLPDLEPIKD